MGAKDQKRRGAGSKSFRPPGAVSRHDKRQRSLARLRAKKDRNVKRSSKGKFETVEAFVTWHNRTYPDRPMERWIYEPRMRRP